MMPGCGDALFARLIEGAGFDAMYISGAWIAASHGYPDVGILGRTDVLDRARAVVGAVKVPVVLDIDTGFGGQSSLWETIRGCEQIGLAGVQIEDQGEPKKCGLLADKTVVTPEQMNARLAAATDARQDESFVIVARTDALEKEGVDGVLRRADAYFSAGADALFVEGFKSVSDVQTVGEALPGKTLLFNQAPRPFGPFVPPSDLADWGYAAIIYPLHPILAGLKTAAAFLQDLRANGQCPEWDDELVSVTDFFALADANGHEAVQARLQRQATGGVASEGVVAYDRPAGA
jgi:2-methylisocitrate lyase-like PEP mutase family enzyme